jgi:hypothetical protein
MVVRVTSERGVPPASALDTAKRAAETAVCSDVIGSKSEYVPYTDE